MNEFYSIAAEGKETSSPLQLTNIGKEKILASFGNKYGVEHLYSPTTSDDYDHSFASKIITTKPPYDMIYRIF